MINEAVKYVCLRLSKITILSNIFIIIGYDASLNRYGSGSLFRMIQFYQNLIIIPNPFLLQKSQQNDSKITQKNLQF